ncbi:uncharacterized protein TNCV_2371601 [Trichonephila clavipes]|nr:uncharacterized protein TNCV_2371601 [Trichonephila clavipes]
MSLTLFERRAELTFLPKKDWAWELIGLISIDIAHLIEREPMDKYNDCDHVKKLLLNSPQGRKRCSVTSPRFSELLQQQISRALQERQCLQTTIFVQDGATPHIGRQVKSLLSANFGDNRVISRHFPVAWPSRSPDLTPCDLLLWRFLKDRVYS